MIVQPFGYPLENTLVQKLDMMIARCVQKNPKRDAVLLCEGQEGEGKTTFSVAIGYYIKQKTKREFNHKNVFFDLEAMIEFLKNTESQIAIWDEPALQALSKDSLTKIVKNLERLLMMARKKRHFIIINLAYFNKFSEYIVWQRPLGMIHVYSRNEIQAGRFVYLRKKQLEQLWMDWRTKRKRNYRKFCSKKIRGTFPDVLNPEYKHNVLSDFDLEYYESEKDKAIQSIGMDEPDAKLNEIRFLKYRVSDVKFPIITQVEFAAKLGYELETVKAWHKRYRNIPPPVGYKDPSALNNK